MVSDVICKNQYHTSDARLALRLLYQKYSIGFYINIIEY